MMQCQGLRAGGDRFLADVWFSAYETPRGARITAMVVDTSEDVRDREEAHLEQVLQGSRLLVGAVSHEIRNVCAAIGLVQANLLARLPGLGSEAGLSGASPADGRARAHGLGRALAGEAAGHGDGARARSFAISRLWSRGRCDDAGITLRWDVDTGLPAVLSDPQSLLQVFLNLLRNAETALDGEEKPAIVIRATRSAAMRSRSA